MVYTEQPVNLIHLRTARNNVLRVLGSGDAYLPKRAGKICPPPGFNLELAMLALCFALTALSRGSLHFQGKKSIFLSKSKN